VSIQLNLSSGDHVAQLEMLQSPLARAKSLLQVQLFGLGALLANTVLAIFEVMRSRPSHLPVHLHSWISFKKKVQPFYDSEVKDEPCLPILNHVLQ
jgi:hypothetical protein